MSEQPHPLIPCSQPKDFPWRIGPASPNTPSATGSCGHTVWEYERGVISNHAIGNTVGPRIGWLAKRFGRTTEKCGNCMTREMLKLAACCAHCGGPIHPGMRARIMECSEPATEMLSFLAYATRPTEDENAVVLCASCVPGAMCMTGHWTGTGVQLDHADTTNSCSRHKVVVVRLVHGKRLLSIE